MRTRWVLFLSLLPIVLWGEGLISAQTQPAQPRAHGDDPVRGYTSPSAAKSVEIGDFYLQRGKLKAALSRFQEALKMDAHYAPAYRELGKVYERMGERRKALDAYKRYLDELPSAQDAREAKSIHKAIARLEK